MFALNPHTRPRSRGYGSRQNARDPRGYFVGRPKGYSVCGGRALKRVGSCLRYSTVKARKPSTWFSQCG